VEALTPVPQRYEQLVRCGTSSLAAVGLEFSILSFLVSVAHVRYLEASGLAACAYLLASFVLNRRWAFRADARAASAHQLGCHIAVASVGSGIVLVLLWLLVERARLWYPVAWALSGMVAFLGWTYPMSRRFTFNERPSAAPAPPVNAIARMA
jgi:putative flippase GtrA